LPPFEAVAYCGAILAHGVEEIARGWLSLTRHYWQKNMEAFEALSRGEIMQDLAAAQTQFVRDNLDHIAQAGLRLAELSTQVTQQSAQSVMNGSAWNEPQCTPTTDRVIWATKTFAPDGWFGVQDLFEEQWDLLENPREMMLVLVDTPDRRTNIYVGLPDAALLPDYAGFRVIKRDELPAAAGLLMGVPDEFERHFYSSARR
jgi:hypothetical protein